jgi:hypothetical protein
MSIPRNFSKVAPGASTSGVLNPTNGGTGLTTVGTSGYVLTSDGTNWTSAAAGGGGGATGIGGQVFTASGTFTIPTGVTALKVTVAGGGAGGGNYTGCCPHYGSSGGASSVSSGTQTISTITGSGGGNTGGGGGASGGDLNIPGGSGSVYYAGNSFLGTLSSAVYGAGGYGNTLPTSGAGGTAIKYLTGLTAGNTITVTRGAGGSGAFGGQAGGGGVIIFEW